MEVTVLNRQRSHRVRRRELSAFLERLAVELPGEDADSLAMCLVSDRKMREYNRDFRGRDVPTDVLSFPAGATNAPSGERHLGDIVISVTSAAAQARQARHSLEQELKILVARGSSDAILAPHHIERGKIYARERFGRSQMIDEERIIQAIEMTRFPVPDGP